MKEYGRNESRKGKFERKLESRKMEKNERNLSENGVKLNVELRMLMEV